MGAKFGDEFVERTGAGMTEIEVSAHVVGVALFAVSARASVLAGFADVEGVVGAVAWLGGMAAGTVLVLNWERNVGIEGVAGICHGYDCTLKGYYPSRHNRT